MPHCDSYCVLKLFGTILTVTCTPYTIINLGIIPTKIATQTFPYLSVHVPSHNDTPKRHKEVRVPLHTMTCVHFTLPTPPPKKKTRAGLFVWDPSTESLLSVWRHNMATLWWQPYAALGSRQFSQECDLEDHHSITSWCYQVVGNFHWIFSASDLAIKPSTLEVCSVQHGLKIQQMHLRHRCPSGWAWCR